MSLQMFAVVLACCVLGWTIHLRIGLNYPFAKMFAIVLACCVLGWTIHLQTIDEYGYGQVELTYPSLSVRVPVSWLSSSEGTYVHSIGTLAIAFKTSIFFSVSGLVQLTATPILCGAALILYAYKFLGLSCWPLSFVWVVWPSSFKFCLCQYCQASVCSQTCYAAQASTELLSWAFELYFCSTSSSAP